MPRLSVIQSLSFWLRVALPTWAKGIIVRRPVMVALAERLDLDARAVRFMERLHAAHGGRSVLVRNPIRPQAVLLDPADVATVLAGTPHPFSPASDEKRAALGHFEPASSLVSRGADRAPRRRLNAAVLQPGRPRHDHAGRFRLVVQQEMATVLAAGAARGTLAWPAFAEGWSRLVRRVALGDAARDDHAVSDLMTRLRGRANWAFLLPRDRGAQRDLHARLQAYLDDAGTGSLAAMAAPLQRGGAPDAAPTHQITQWLFAFDAAGMTTFRTLALIAADEMAEAAVRAEIAAAENDLAVLRACVLETLRLYPTTPAILRQTTAPAHLAAGSLPAGAGVVIYAPFFHRARWVAAADRFRPAFWVGRDPETAPPFVPFSAGPAACPGKSLVPLLAAEALRVLLQGTRFSVTAPGWLATGAPLRGTLDNFAIRLAMAVKTGA